MEHYPAIAHHIPPAPAPVVTPAVASSALLQHLNHPFGSSSFYAKAPPPPLPPSAIVTSAASISTTSTSSASSFAAALRNLAHKNNAGTGSDPIGIVSSNAASASTSMISSMAAPIVVASVPPPTSLSSLATAVVPTLAAAEPPALLDVRRGFDRSLSTSETSFESSITSAATLRTAAEMVTASAGFQPYRPAENTILSPSNSITPFPSAVVNNAIATPTPYAYHPAYFPSAAAAATHLSYGLETEAFYRAHLERYTSLARLHYPWAAAAAPPTQPAAAVAAATELLPSFPTYFSTTSTSSNNSSTITTTSASPSPERKRRRSSKEVSTSPPAKKSLHEMPTTTGAPTLRPPPCLTTPPSIVTPVDIRLPTQPLDISCVKDIAVSAAPPPLPIPSEMKGEPCNAENSSKTVNVLRNVRSKSSSKDLHTSIGVPHGIKKQFVRPFEDDYNTTDYTLKHEDSEHIKPEEEEESSPAIVSSLEASFKNNNNNVIMPSPKGKTKEKEGGKAERQNVSKEKLKYLRYFRLGNRKRHEEKVGKRDYPCSSRLRSPSPLKSLFEATTRPTTSSSKPPSPTLPLPSRTTKLPPETNAKLMFFTMLGLLKLGDTDKKEHEMIWDVILDDKLSRQCNSTTMSYFMKLQEQTSEEPCSKTQKDTVFLNSQDLINHHPTKVSSTPTPPEVATSPDSNNPGYNKKPLPINLSTLLPVSKNSLTNVVECMQKPTWLQSGTLNIPGLSSVLNKSLVTSTPLPEAPAITWPGIEAIRDAYMKYHEDTSQLLLRLRETQSKQQEEMSQKRATIDHLSTQMASLASHHKELRAKNNQLCDSARILAESLSKLKE